MRSRLVPALPLALALVLSLGACGGSSSVPDGAGEATSVLTLSSDGRLLVEGEVATSVGFVLAVPSRWPTELGPPPTIAAGETVRSGDAIEFLPWALASNAQVEHFALRGERQPAWTSTAKHACQISARGAREVSMSCGEVHGVTEGDLYFVYGDEHAQREDRAGARTSALLRVTDVDDKESTARIEHARLRPETGEIAVFAQASFDLPTPAAAILVAPFVEGTEPAAFPAIADALPEYLAEFGVSNVSVQAFEEFLDPTPPDAAELASAAAETSGVAYGAIVFGHVDEGVLVFNATAFGKPPHPATTVGVLPGGLPLPISDSLEALSRQLAPSFLATVLALRGDHAIAVYALESILATETLESDVRYHLREHLALRYNSIGRPLEALRIMATDIEEGARNGDAFVELNARSIRSHLAEQSGLIELWTTDLENFLTTAAGVLPETSLVRERLELARARDIGGDHDAALVLIEEVLADGRERGDRDTEYAALVERAFAMVDDPLVARLAFTELEPLMQELEPEQRALVYLVTAELAAADGERAVADTAIRNALAEVSDDASDPMRASVFRRAASVFSAIGRPQEAGASLQEATRLFLETGQLQRASIALVELAFAQLEWAQQAHDSQAHAQVQQARNNLLLGAELAGRLGNYADAAQAFLWTGLFEYQIGRHDVGEQLVDRAAQFAYASGDYRALHEVYTSWAQIKAERGDMEGAEALQARALLFARAGEIETPASQIESGVE